MYTITLENNYKIENVAMNGNNYIASDVVDDSVFDNNLGKVIIFDGENETIYNDMVLLSNIVRNGKSWIVLGQKTEQQKEKEAYDLAIRNLQLASVETYELLLQMMGV